jgi:2-dehydro-3-deoxy-D-arabinonate dehydratase
LAQLCRFQHGAAAPRLGLLQGAAVRDLSATGIPELTDLDSAFALPLAELRTLVEQAARADLPSYPSPDVRLLAPIQGQEVWAAGVTYLRSREARVEEATEKSVYERVYDAERPEIFMKSAASRTVGPGESMRLRHDSTWDVPEPELALVLNRRLELLGYTAGNDLSSRSIEGENPLYLPQAKTWLGCCALGPAITPSWERGADRPFAIDVRIRRGGVEVFGGVTSTDQMKRSFADLVEHLGRDNAFPHGVILLTGTGLVPPSGFTLESGDEVDVTVEDVGTLHNPVVRGDGLYALAE